MQRGLILSVLRKFSSQQPEGISGNHFSKKRKHV